MAENEKIILDINLRYNSEALKEKTKAAQEIAAARKKEEKKIEEAQKKASYGRRHLSDDVITKDDEPNLEKQRVYAVSGFHLDRKYVYEPAENEDRDVYTIYSLNGTATATLKFPIQRNGESINNQFETKQDGSNYEFIADRTVYNYFDYVESNPYIFPVSAERCLAVVQGSHSRISITRNTRFTDKYTVKSLYSHTYFTGVTKTYGTGFINVFNFKHTEEIGARESENTTTVFLVSYENIEEINTPEGLQELLKPYVYNFNEQEHILTVKIETEPYTGAADQYGFITGTRESTIKDFRSVIVPWGSPPPPELEGETTQDIVSVVGQFTEYLFAKASIEYEGTVTRITFEENGGENLFETIEQPQEDFRIKNEILHYLGSASDNGRDLLVTPGTFKAADPALTLAEDVTPEELMEDLYVYGTVPAVSLRLNENSIKEEDGITYERWDIVRGFYSIEPPQEGEVALDINSSGRIRSFVPGAMSYKAWDWGNAEYTQTQLKKLGFTDTDLAFSE